MWEFSAIFNCNCILTVHGCLTRDFLRTGSQRFRSGKLLCLFVRTSQHNMQLKMKRVKKSYCSRLCLTSRHCDPLHYIPELRPEHAFEKHFPNCFNDKCLFGSKQLNQICILVEFKCSISLWLRLILFCYSCCWMSETTV